MMNRLAAVMVVVVMGLTAFGAKAQSYTDNLQLEVTVKIPGTVDLQWATGTTGLAAGTSENGTDNRIDAVGTAGAADFAAWIISNPDFGQTRSTDGTTSLPASLNATDGPTVLRLDNVGKRKVTVAATILTGGVDSATPAWTMSSAPAASVFSLSIRAAAVGTGDDIVAADLPNTAYATLHNGTAIQTVTLCTNYGRNSKLLEVDLQYKTPTDVNNDTELDVDHKTTITVTGTASF